MSVKDAVAQRILALCEERKCKVNALANAAGLTPSTLYSILDPLRRDVGIVAIKTLCDGLDITLSAFFEADCFAELDQEVK